MDLYVTELNIQYNSFFLKKLTSRRIRVSDNLLDVVDVPVLHPRSLLFISRGNVITDVR
jgi:hypothetical protein